MTAPIKRLRELRGMPVVDISSAHRMGSVLNVHLDPNAGSVESLDVGRASGEMIERHVKVVDVRRIGKDAIVVMPIPTNGHHQQATLDGFIDTAGIMRLEVLDERGDRVGFISDVLINADTLAVHAYELQTSVMERLFRGPRRITPDRVVVCSQDVMLVHASSTPVTITVSPERATGRHPDPPSSEETELDRTAVRTG